MALSVASPTSSGIDSLQKFSNIYIYLLSYLMKSKLNLVELSRQSG